MNTYAQLTCLKKVRTKVRFKEYHLVKQGLHELEADKKKDIKVEIIYIAEVGSSNTPSPYLLPLANPFNFNLSFLILPDIISNNMPILFL